MFLKLFNRGACTTKCLGHRYKQDAQLSQRDHGAALQGALLDWNVAKRSNYPAESFVSKFCSDNNLQWLDH